MGHLDSGEETRARMEYLSSARRRASSAVFRVRSAPCTSPAAPTWEEQEISARAPDDSQTSRRPSPAQPDPPPEAGERREAALGAVHGGRLERLELALLKCVGPTALGGWEALARRRWRFGLCCGLAGGAVVSPVARTTLLF